MKKFILIFILLFSFNLMADEIDDMSSRMNSYFDQQDQIVTDLQTEINSLQGKTKEGDEIIFSLNSRIEALIQINKEVSNQRDLFGYLIDDQVAGYKASLFKWRVYVIGLCLLIGLYVALRLLKKFEPHCRIFLFWLP